jgi:hypothetical protein
MLLFHHFCMKPSFCCRILPIVMELILPKHPEKNYCQSLGFDERILLLKNHYMHPGSYQVKTSENMLIS